MKELLDSVVSEIYGAWRFRWWGMALAWVIALGGWVYISLMPNQYEAHARVLVNTNTDLRDIIQRQGLTIPPDIISEVEQVRLAMLGRPQLEKVARQTDLHLSVGSAAEMEYLVSSLRSRITIEGGGSDGRRSEGDNLFAISMTYPSRQKAIDVVSTLLNILVEDTLGASRSGAESSIRVLEEQQAKAEARLTRAENRRRDFRREHSGLMPDERGGYFERLQTAQTSLREAERERELKRNELQQIEAQLRSERPVLSSTPGELPENSLDARIQRLEAEIADLLIRFTGKHPEVVAKRETLEQLRKRRAEELNAMGVDGASGSAASANPVHQQLRIERNKVAVEIGRLDVTIADLRQRIGELGATRDRAIEVETELSQLDRDYAIVQEQYNSITQALEKAKLSDDVVGPVEFQIIDPPSAELEPVAPNRPLLVLLCLVAALGAGGGLAFVIHQVRPVFNTGRELRLATDLPVLGTVAMAWRDEFRKRTLRQSVAFGLVGLGLVGTCGVALTLSAAGVFPL